MKPSFTRAELASLHLFQSVEFEVVEPLVRHCKVKMLQAGEVLIAADKLNYHLYLLLSGQLQVRLTSVADEPVVTLDTGDCVGELSLIDSQPASAFVVAAAPCRLLVLDEALVWRLAEHSHAVAKNLLVTLSQRLRYFNKLVAQDRVRLRDVIDSLSEGLVVTDREGRLIVVNERVPELFPRAVPFIKPGSRFADVVRALARQGHYGRGKEQGAVEAIVAERLRLRNSAPCRHEMRVAAGQWFQVNERPTQAGGIVTTWTDITDLKQREHALREAQQLAAAREAANRAKSEFLATMSHELRTPLNGILGYAQLLQRQSGLSAKQQEGLEVIRQCGEHLLGLINEVLDLAKIEAGKLELQPQAFALAPLLQGVAALFRPRAEQKGLEFFYDAPAALPEAVYGDDQRLRQVLINLLGNAVKFTDAGKITLRVHPAGSRLRFTVADTGAGIAPAQLEEIFQPFVQLGARKDNREGTGLGLAISHRLVAMLGGELHVASTPGQGSRFWFDLALPPAVLSSPSPVQQQAIVGFEGPPRRVLIVDDKAVNRALLAGLLGPLGFECRDAVDGADCLRKAREQRPELILMDLVMPGLDGLEATRRLRQQPEFKNVVIIALSASALDSDKALSLAIGCDDFIAKPVQIEILLARLQRWLNLSWRYASLDPAAAAAAPLAPSPEQLPEALANALWQAARKGHAKGVLRQLTQLEAAGEPYAAFARQLHGLARQFRFDALAALVEPFVARKD